MAIRAFIARSTKDVHIIFRREVVLSTTRIASLSLRDRRFVIPFFFSSLYQHHAIRIQRLATNLFSHGFSENANMYGMKWHGSFGWL